MAKDTVERPLKELSERELRDKGMRAIEQMRDLYEEKRAGKEVPADKEAQVDAWNLESEMVEKEFEFRRRERGMEMNGPKIPGTTIESDEKFDPNFKPTRRDISQVLNKIERRKGVELTPTEAKVHNLMNKEAEIFERALTAYLVDGANAVNEILTEEERKIFTNQQTRDRWDYWRKEQRVGSQSTSTTAGGYTIPQGFIPRVVRSLKYISAFFDEFSVGPNGELANTFALYKTDAGNDLPMPTGDDTANTGELLAENGDASTSTADLVFGQITLKAYKYSTKMIKASTELLQDSAIDVPGYVADMFGSRLGRIMNSHFTTGTNSSQPQGIVTGATQGKFTASSSAVTFPEIIDLIHSVDPSYRNSPSCRFMFHDNILLALKKLTVGSATNNARPLWQPSYDVSAPATIDGYRYLINQNMASSQTSGAKIILFGDMKQFAVRLVNVYRLLSLRERYAETDQTAWVGFMRADSKMLNSSAIKYLKNT